MKKLQNLKSLLIVLTILCSSATLLRAQIVGTSAYMQNPYTEVGVSNCGSYGTPTSAPAPAGYHPNVGARLGFVCDAATDGWTVGAPAYCGDYFVPGSPEEGWSVTFNGTHWGNRQPTCASAVGATLFPSAAPIQYLPGAAADTIIWTGLTGGLEITQRTILPTDSLFFFTEVVLCNQGATTLTGVFYARNVDPDNDQPWPGGSFTTTNTIVSQPIGGATDALVQAIGPTGCYLGLGARDTRARVNYGNFSTQTAPGYYTGTHTGLVQTVGSTNVADEGISIGYSLGDLTPGSCTCLAYAYIMDASMLESALSATVGITVFSDTIDITSSLATTRCVDGDSITLILSGGAGAISGWHWSPPYGLSDTVGLSVKAAPDVTTTYTIIGTDTSGGAGISCGTDTLTITVTVDTVPADAGPDISVCLGDSGTIGTAADPQHSYSWTPTTGLGSPTSSITNVSGPAGTYTYFLEETDTLFGCVGYDTVTVTITPLPPPNFSLPDSGCTGDPVTVTYIGTPDPGASYTWDFGAGATPASASTVGPHVVTWSTPGMKDVTLQIVTAAGCTTTVGIDSIMIHALPVALVDPVADQCFDGNLFDFTHTGSTYDPASSFSWSFGADAVPPTSTDENPTGVTFTSPGSKYASLQITNHGCLSNIDSITFTVFPMPDASFTSLSGPQCFDGNSYDFVANVGPNGPGATYDWSFEDGIPASASGITPPGVTFTSPGLKEVTLTVIENGCISVFTDTIEVYSNPTVDAGADVSFCEGEGGVMLNGSGVGGTTPYYWTWWCAGPAHARWIQSMIMIRSLILRLITCIMYRSPTQMDVYLISTPLL